MMSKLDPSTISQVGSQLVEQVGNTRAPTVSMPTPEKKMMIRMSTMDTQDEVTRGAASSCWREIIREICFSRIEG